jgi:hypothetical protein
MNNKFGNKSLLKYKNYLSKFNSKRNERDNVNQVVGKNLLFQSKAAQFLQSNRFSSTLNQFTNNGNLSQLKTSDYYFKDYHTVNEVYTKSGAIENVPSWYRFGITKLILTFTLFLLIGAQISKTGVKILEENDIFKPEDDDDEDD